MRSTPRYGVGHPMNAVAADRNEAGHWWRPCAECSPLRHLSPRSGMAKAIAYGTKHRPALSRFLGDGRLEIDNNVAERALRGAAVGRRDWLFAGSRAGGERAAAVYTVIQTCKASGVYPQRYITDVISKIAGDWPGSQWDQLVL